MSKLRVYKVAEQLGMDNKALVALFQSLGVDEVRNHMSTVSAEQVERARRHLSRSEDDKVVEERVRGGGGAGVIIRRKKAADTEEVVEATPPIRRPARVVTAEAVPAPRQPERAPAPPPAPVQSVPATQEPAPGAVPEPAPVVVAAEPAPAPVAKAEEVTEAAKAPAVAAPEPVKEPEAAPSVSRDVVSKEEKAVEVAPPQPASAEPAFAAAAEAAPAPAAPTEATAVEAPSAKERSAKERSAKEPSANERSAEERSAKEPSAKEPSANERSVEERSVEEPSVEEPSAKERSAKERSAKDLSAEEHSERSAKEPSVVAAPVPAPPAVETKAEKAAPQAPALAPQPPKSSGATEPIRRVGAPLGPAAAAAARAAERAREAGNQGGSVNPSTPPQSARVADARTVQRPRPTTSEVPARPAPKTGIDVWEGRPGVPMPQAPRNSGVPRRVQYDAKGGAAGASQLPRRGPQTGGQGGNARGRNMSTGPGGRRGVGQFGNRRVGSSSVVTQERSAHKKVVRIEGDISLQNLAAKMGVKAGEVLMKLMSLGMSGININSTLDSDTAKIVGEEFGWSVEDVAVSEDAAIAAAQGGEPEEDDGEREPRPPVVTVMGHVDHGKTSLLDKIRRASVAQGEAGGITQHIGAYSVKTKKGRVTFLDTPGHAAFTQMRARGAKVTDVVVLVVAADDGVMPQTREAVSHAKDAKCPIVVAVNKIDKPDAQPERVRRELSELGLVPEEWGGDTLFCEVSAHSGQGIDDLLDSILLQAEVLDLRANPKRHARGTVIEAKLDRGQGPVATVLVTDGTLRKGDGVLVGNSWGKVRAMLDEHGRNVPSAGPSTPVAVIGLSEVPSAGDIVDAVSDAKKAQQIAEQRRDKLAEKSRGSTSKISLEELARRMSQSDQKELKLIIKGDVQGSVEALSEALSRLSTDKVRVTVVNSGVGAVTEGDVNLAVAAKAIIISFNARPAGKAATLAQKEEIEIRQYSIIYDAIDDVLVTMQGLLAPKLVEEAIGEAEVRKIFKVSKSGVVAGCMVTNGVVRRNSFVRLRRGKDVIWEGKLESLRRFKDDAKEVREGFDCGISFAGFNDLQEGDIVAAYEIKEVRPTL